MSIFLLTYPQYYATFGLMMQYHKQVGNYPTKQKKGDQKMLSREMCIVRQYLALARVKADFRDIGIYNRHITLHSQDFQIMIVHDGEGLYTATISSRKDGHPHLEIITHDGELERAVNHVNEALDILYRRKAAFEGLGVRMRTTGFEDI